MRMISELRATIVPNMERSNSWVVTGTPVVAPFANKELVLAILVLLAAMVAVVVLVPEVLAALVDGMCVEVEG